MGVVVELDELEDGFVVVELVDEVGAGVEVEVKVGTGDWVVIVEIVDEVEAGVEVEVEVGTGVWVEVVELEDEVEVLAFW